MAFVFAQTYSPESEAASVAFYATLSEKDQRRFVAIEATRMGFGGIAYVASVFDCSRKTVERGIAELEHLPNDPAAGRIRRPGGGRKKSRCGPATGGKLDVSLGRTNGG